MATLKHELWETPEGETIFCLAGPMGDHARSMMPANAKLVWTLEAGNHFDAMSKYHAHRSLPPYVLEQEWDLRPYPEEWLEIQLSGNVSTFSNPNDRSHS